MPWESPIKLDYTPFWEQIVDAQENAIYKAVLKVNISVDREEMVKALKYDRNQWKRGYQDGKMDAEHNIIRCRDCKYRYINGDNVVVNYCLLAHNKVQSDDWYCADAERREDD